MKQWQSLAVKAKGGGFMSYKDMFEASLKAEGITGAKAAFARSINHQESGGGVNTSTSNAGAYGGMQIIPGTFATVADKGWDIKNPEHNARAGIRYAMQMFEKAGGDPALAAAGYYGGPGGLEKARRGVAVSDPRNPNAPTTLQYGQQVAARIRGGQGTVVNPLAMPDEAIVAAARQSGAVGGVEIPPELLPQVVAKTAPKELLVAPVYSPEDPWADMAQLGRQEVRPVDLSYGDERDGFGFPKPKSVIPQGIAAPDFKAFGGFKGRA